MPFTVTTTASKSVTITKVKAKHIANQAGLDRLQELLVKATSNPNAGQNYALTIKRAFRSLQECKEPILTQKDAIKLKYVGPAMAKRICPQSTGVEVSKASKATKSKTSIGKDVISKGGTNDHTTGGGSVLGESVAVAGASRGQTSGRKLVCPCPSLPSTSQCTSFLDSFSSLPPTAKEKAYAAAKMEAERLLLPAKGPWKVILLVDIREHKSKQVVSSCKQAGIPCEERQLAIGDMAWIARCVVANEQSLLTTSTGPSKKRKKPTEDDKFRTIEIMVGTIIERKEVSDLASSLFGTRYAEQRLRLSQSGIPQVLFLVEGNLASASNCPAETLQMAMMETRINLGFQIVQTKNLMDTVSILKTLHARIVQRTFPEAFGKSSERGSPKGQTLPTFVGGNKRRGGRGNRRASSLLELVFDTTPIPPFGSKRFITYPELKAKVEVDRERGTRSVRAISLAMMKQIPTLSQKKCTSIAHHYPTLNRLLLALSYPDSSNEKKHPKKAVQDIEIDSGRRTIGPVSASEVYAACCTLQDGSTVVCHEQETRPAAGKSSQTRLSSYLLRADTFGGEGNENKPAAKNDEIHPCKKARTKEQRTSPTASSLNDSPLKESGRAFTNRRRPSPSLTTTRQVPERQVRMEHQHAPRFDIGSPSRRNKQNKIQHETVDLLTPESNAKPKAKTSASKKVIVMDLSDGSDSCHDFRGITNFGSTNSSAGNAKSSLKLPAAMRNDLHTSDGEDTFLLSPDREDNRLLSTDIARRRLASSDGEDTVHLSADEKDSPLLATNAFPNGIAKGETSKRTAAKLTCQDSLLLTSEDEESSFHPTKDSNKAVLGIYNLKQSGSVNGLGSNNRATLSGKRLSVDTSLDDGSSLFSSPDETTSKGSNRNLPKSSFEKKCPHQAKSAKDSEIVCLLDDSDEDSTSKNGATKLSNAFVTTTRGGALHSTQESTFDSEGDSSDEDHSNYGTSLRKRLGKIRGQDLKEVIELDSDSD